MFSGNILLRRCYYVSKLTSKSSYMTNVVSRMQCLIINCLNYDIKYVFRYSVPEYHDVFVYLIVGKDYIDV